MSIRDELAEVIFNRSNINGETYVDTLYQHEAYAFADAILEYFTVTDRRPRIWSKSEANQIPHDVTVKDRDGYEWAWGEGEFSSGWHMNGQITAFKDGPNPWCAPFTEMLGVEA